MRKQGTFPESSNIEGKIAWTFDARNMVQSYADLLTFTPANYIPNGFPVAVFDADPSKRGIYICINKNLLANAASWEKIGSAGSSFDPSNYYTKQEINEAFLSEFEFGVNFGDSGSFSFNYDDQGLNDLYGTNPSIKIYELNNDNTIKTFLSGFGYSYNSSTGEMIIEGVFGQKQVVIKR